MTASHRGRLCFATIFIDLATEDRAKVAKSFAGDLGTGNAADRSMPNLPPQVLTSARPERRAFRRAVVGLPVLIETEDASHSGRTTNLSAGGVAVETELDLPEGAAVSVYLELPIGYAVDCRAVVLRREGRVVALRFVDLAKEAEIALRSFCRLSGLHRFERT